MNRVKKIIGKIPGVKRAYGHIHPAIYESRRKFSKECDGNLSYKNYVENSFWEQKYFAEAEGGGKLDNSHYEYFFTTHFDLAKEYYTGKRILDIGCGPRGSLEWADNASARIGIDPIADSYMKFGIDDLNMIYVHSGAESIPFPDSYFDVISSFNSLDHVDDLDKVVMQIKKKLKPSGMFLLLTDVNHKPTPTEPQVLTWDIISLFSPEFSLIKKKHYEKPDGDGLYQSIKLNEEYDHDNSKERYGILSACFQKITNSKE